jgi:hypothetical protein
MVGEIVEQVKKEREKLKSTKTRLLGRSPQVNYTN